MHPTARLAALAVALCASGCWTNACIENSSHGVRCSEEVDGIATEPADDDDPGGLGDSGRSCTKHELGTTCEEAGYPYHCGRDGYWYKYRCE